MRTLRLDAVPGAVEAWPAARGMIDHVARSIEAALPASINWTNNLVLLADQHRHLWSPELLRSRARAAAWNAARKPHAASLWHNLGSILSGLGRHEEAAEAFERAWAVSRDPGWRAAFMARRVLELDDSGCTALARAEAQWMLEAASLAPTPKHPEVEALVALALRRVGVTCGAVGGDGR